MPRPGKRAVSRKAGAGMLCAPHVGLSKSVTKSTKTIAMRVQYPFVPTSNMHSKPKRERPKKLRGVKNDAMRNGAEKRNQKGRSGRTKGSKDTQVREE
jgi:hypothetical protein